MIPDATLAEWEQMADRGHPALSSPLLAAISEIRRLREEHRQIDKLGCATLYRQRNEAEAALAAHQAVIRELAEAIIRWRRAALGRIGHWALCDVCPADGPLRCAKGTQLLVEWSEACHHLTAVADALDSNPLVVAARTGP